MTCILFNQKTVIDVLEVSSWFGTNCPKDRFQDITKNMFCKLAKISHPAHLEACIFNLELTIELIRQCDFNSLGHPTQNLKIKMSRGLMIELHCTYRIIMEYPSIFNTNPKLVWANCYVCNCWLHCIQTL